MRRACVSTVRSTEAKAQPAARRPEAQRRDTPKKINLISIIKGFATLEK
ncbi:MAG: hypothetical protein NZ455_15435 [Bacteroidia bacterium]|nr:hypothetical protein [Bacteroidia bacterium]MDW8347932.1 hypothetical protein [Bacteroidia bacterium]